MRGNLRFAGRKSLKDMVSGTALGLYLPAGAWNNCGVVPRCMAQPKVSSLRDVGLSRGDFGELRC
jgi:hypothetical protein